MNKRKFVAPRLKAGGAPVHAGPQASPPAMGPEPKRPALPNSKAPAPAAAPAPAPPFRRIFRLPAVASVSMPSLESLGFDVSLPPARAVLGSLPRAPVPAELLIHLAAPGADALAAAAAALHEAALPGYLAEPQRLHVGLRTILSLPKASYGPRCRAAGERMEGAIPAPARQPLCAQSDATARSVPASVISTAVWVPTPELGARPGAAARRRLAEDAEIPLAALKAMLLG